jgi:hypothetical protein
MRHTVEDLLAIVYRYYPHGIAAPGDLCDPRRKETEEYARLVAARKKAAADERWHAMRRRVAERFPRLMNYSLHLRGSGHGRLRRSRRRDPRRHGCWATHGHHLRVLRRIYIGAGALGVGEGEFLRRVRRRA